MIGLPLKPVHWILPLEVALKLMEVVVQFNAPGVAKVSVGLVMSWVTVTLSDLVQPFVPVAVA